MNIYDLLTLIIENITWRNEASKGDALKVVDQLRELNAFGTVASDMVAIGHEHSYIRAAEPYSTIGTWYFQKCRYCDLELEGSRHLISQITHREIGW